MIRPVPSRSRQDGVEVSFHVLLPACSWNDMVKLELTDRRSQAVFTALPSATAHDQPNQGIAGIMTVTTGQLLQKGMKR